MDWKWNGTEPVFFQLARGLRTEILRGTYAPGTQIPTVRQLAAEATVNPNTVQRALSLLEEEGLVHSNGTQGRFVTEDEEMLQAARITERRQVLRQLLEGAKALGISREEMLEFLREEQVHE